MKLKIILLLLIIIIGIIGYLIYRNTRRSLILPVDQSNSISNLDDQITSLSLIIKNKNSLDNQAVEYEVNNGLGIIFSFKKKIKPQLDSLQLILQRAKIDGRKLSVIDLRFDKPVIEYNTE